MENISKELKVSALENGTVLDHIPAENVYRALDILGLKGISNQITIGINLNSKLQTWTMRFTISSKSPFCNTPFKGNLFRRIRMTSRQAYF